MPPTACPHLLPNSFMFFVLVHFLSLPPLFVDVLIPVSATMPLCGCPPAHGALHQRRQQPSVEAPHAALLVQRAERCAG